MASASKNKSSSAKGNTPAEFLRDGPNLPVFALAAIGMILSAYLTFVGWQGKTAAFCTEGGGCDIVLNSQWATLLGVPTSLWGFLSYALLAAVAWDRRADNQWRVGWFIALFGVLFSLYLTSISLFQLEAACPYCLTSLGLMTVIFLIITFQKPALANFSWGSWLAKTASPAIVGVLLIHLHFAGYIGSRPQPEDPWLRGLAEHLTSTGAKFYGASWCPHCIDQKEKFGAAAKRLPYIECSPGGRQAPPAPECIAKNIQSYPTWIINGERYNGTQTVESLAQMTQFKLKEAKP